MKCKYCGGRSFNITIEAYQRVDYNKKGEVEYTDTFEFGDWIEEEGATCNSCGRELKRNEMIDLK